MSVPIRKLFRPFQLLHIGLSTIQQPFASALNSFRGAMAEKVFLEQHQVVFEQNMTLVAKVCL